MSVPGLPGLGRAVWPILIAALALKLVFVASTDYQLRHDARDYDRHAVSIAQGEGYPDAKAPGRATAFRPPAYPVLLAGAYALTGVTDAPDPDRVLVARILGAVLTTIALALLGILAGRLWGRRVGLVAVALGALYLPLTLVGGSVMSEPLFVVLVLAALLVALAFRGTPRHRLALAAVAGLLTGLTILTRANAVVLLVPLLAAFWDGRPWLSRRAIAPPALLLVTALLVVTPWTIRNAVVFDTFIPVSTQLGSALAGTYNDQAREDREDPASWRAVRNIPQLHVDIRGTPEPRLERELRARALRYAADHPGYVGEVAFWNTARMLDLAGLAKARQTTSTIGISGHWAEWAVPCFWIFAALALAGLATGRARAAPWWIWAVPVLLYLGVVAMVVETPRYRAGIDPFVIALAAVAVVWGWDRLRPIAHLRRSCAG